MFSTIKNIHFIGIGGSGMSGIAEVLLNQGYVVSGSDSKMTATTHRLEKLGARIALGHSAEAIKDAHVVVVSSAIDKQNPELAAAAAARIPVIHRSEMLAELMRLKYGVVVAGTHGKTTTTSLLATVLTTAGLDPTVVIGGRLNAYDSSAKLGKGELFVAEADESDGSFLRLTPTVAVLTNIDRDHLDHYKGFADIFAAFEIFIDKVPFYGAVCACIDDPAVEAILPKVRRKLLTYGLRPDADITAQDLLFDGCFSHFTPVIAGRATERVQLKMPGRYNVTNALASFAVGQVLGVNPALVSRALSQFEGVLHRFTVLGTVENVMVVDDYAHNPAKIAAVLKGTRESFPGQHVVAVFQPHRYSRIVHMLDDFARSFGDADSVIVTPIYAASEQPISGITPEALVGQICQGSFQGRTGNTFEATDLRHAASLAAGLAKSHNNGAGVIVLTLGAGDIQGVGPKILEILKGDAP